MALPNIPPVASNALPMASNVLPASSNGKALFRAKAAEDAQTLPVLSCRDVQSYRSFRFERHVMGHRLAGSQSLLVGLPGNPHRLHICNNPPRPLL
jgi:hypothetical protein